MGKRRVIETYRRVKKELRRLFRFYGSISTEDVNCCIDFLLKQFKKTRLDVETEEFKLRVINKLIREGIIGKDKEEGLFISKMDGTKLEYTPEISLILHFNLFLLSLHKKGKIVFERDQFIYKEGNERALIKVLPWLSPERPYYLKECIKILKSYPDRNYKMIFLFKNKSTAVNTVKLILKEKIPVTLNDLFFFQSESDPFKFIQFKFKEQEDIILSTKV